MSSLTVSSTKENFCGLKWECYHVQSIPTTYFMGDSWCVEYDKNKECWNLWQSLDLKFNSPLLMFVFMVARELIFEAASEQFIPMWEQHGVKNES